jgi:hypothetical protein
MRIPAIVMAMNDVAVVEMEVWTTPYRRDVAMYIILAVKNMTR